MHGLLGRHVHVTVSPGTPQGLNAVGFAGVLENAVGTDFPIVSTGDEQLVFFVRPSTGGTDGAYFTLSPSTFASATWATGDHATELVFRTGDLDLALLPTGDDPQ